MKISFLKLSLLLIATFLVVPSGKAQILETVEQTGTVLNTDSVIQETYKWMGLIDASTVEQSRENKVPVKVALVMSDIADNKDIEFARGMLLALEEMKESPYRVSFKMFNGAVGADSLKVELNKFAPTLIVGNYEKNFPLALSAYARDNKVKTVNVFDMKNEAYVYNPEMIQLLTPSTYFNEEIADYLANGYSGYEILSFGVPDSSDQLYEKLVSKMGKEPRLIAEIDDLAAFKPEDGKKYLIYVNQTQKDNVKAALAEIIKFSNANPLAFVTTIGRPSWITMTDLAASLEDANVMIPSRCYFDPTTYEGKKFITDYNSSYGHTPIKSFPVYSAMGYDVMKFFVPGIDESNNNYNKIWPKTQTLQTDIDFRKSSENSGYYTPMVYVVKFKRNGNAEKISIK